MRVYLLSVRMNLMAGLQYRGWPLTVLQVMFVVVTDPIAVVLMFMRFGSMGAWRMEQILLCYAMAVLCFGLAETFLRGFDYFPMHVIRAGAFDRYLLRPIPLFWQIAGAYFHIHRLSRVVGGLAVVVWALARLGAVLTVGRLAVLLLTVLCGMALYGATFMLIAGCSFWSVKGLELFNVMTNASYQVVRVPMAYLPKGLRMAFTFFMPLLVVVVYPLSWVCGWGAAWWQALLPIPAVAVYLAFCWLIWHIGVSKYQGTGS